MNKPPLRVLVYRDARDLQTVIIVRDGGETLATEYIDDSDVVFADPEDMGKPIANAIESLAKTTGIYWETIASLIYKGEGKAVIDRLFYENYRLRNPKPQPAPKPVKADTPPPVEAQSGWGAFLDSIGSALMRSADDPIPQARVVKEKPKD